MPDEAKRNLAHTTVEKKATTGEMEVTGREASKGAQAKGGYRIAAKVLNATSILLFAVLIATLLPIAVPSIFGMGVYSVASGSMEPAIPVGSLAIVAKADPAKVQAGEVIAFTQVDAAGLKRAEGIKAAAPETSSAQDGASVITHRVVDNRYVEGEFVTKGDANEGEDINTVPYSNFNGVVVLTVPVLGELLAIYGNLAGKIYAALIAVIALMTAMLARSLRRKSLETQQAQ